MDDTKLYNTFIGIDIAKKKFDVAICIENNKFKHKVFANNTQGFNDFYQWLMKFDGKMLFVMEATNIYYEDLADFLHSKDLSVAVINPKTMPNFSKCLNLRNKTDKVDAKALAEFARIQSDRIRLYEPKTKIERELLRKNRQLKHINNMIVKEKIRIQTMKDEYCIAVSKNVIAFLEEQEKLLEKEIKSTINSDETMKKNNELLRSIPAVGEKTAWSLLAHLGNGERFKNSKDAASFFGLTPMRRQSGSSLNAVVGISKIGHSDVRAVLYPPAMNFTCGQFKNREYEPFVKRLLSQGKPPKVVIVALMRKIVTIAFALLKSQTKFDATKLGFQAA